MKVVKELEPVDIASQIHRRRRIVVLQRDDGFFSFAEEYFYISEYDGEIVSHGWARLPPHGVYPTSDVAEAEGLLLFARRHKLAI